MFWHLSGMVDLDLFWCIAVTLRDIPKTEKFLQVPTCQIWWKMENWQTFKKPPIFHPRVVSTILIRCWCPLGWKMENRESFQKQSIFFLSVVNIILIRSWSPLGWLVMDNSLDFLQSKATGLDLWNRMKNPKCQTCWKPSILLDTVVRHCSTGYDIGMVDLDLFWCISRK